MGILRQGGGGPSKGTTLSRQRDLVDRIDSHHFISGGPGGTP